MLKFQKTVSKGTRFNQIYVPKQMDGLIEVGDEVEVRLVRKHVRLHYAKGLNKLSAFKENLIREVFSFLGETFSPVQIFFVGSFLTEHVHYKDIDIVIINDKKQNKFDDTVYASLTERFDLNFHIISMEEKSFHRLLSACPLTRSMFSTFVGNKPMALPAEQTVDWNHVQFLLMMPQDLLEITLGSRAFFDGLRRLITIERFLTKKSLEGSTIATELKTTLGSRLYTLMKANEPLDDALIAFVRRIIKTKLLAIERFAGEHGKKR
jgi:hypothetical protein